MNFNVIDFLLNEGEWTLTNNVLNVWKEKLLLWYIFIISTTNCLALYLALNALDLCISFVQDTLHTSLFMPLYVSVPIIINL